MDAPNVYQQHLDQYGEVLPDATYAFIAAMAAEDPADAEEADEASGGAMDYFTAARVYGSPYYMEG